MARRKVKDDPIRIRIYSSSHARLLWEYWQRSIRRKAREIGIIALPFTVKSWARFCYVTG